MNALCHPSSSKPAFNAPWHTTSVKPNACKALLVLLRSLLCILDLIDSLGPGDLQVGCNHSTSRLAPGVQLTEVVVIASRQPKVVVRRRSQMMPPPCHALKQLIETTTIVELLKPHRPEGDEYARDRCAGYQERRQVIYLLVLHVVGRTYIKKLKTLLAAFD